MQFEPDRFDQFSSKERFIPVTRAALLDRLLQTERDAGGDSSLLRRAFGHLTVWRNHTYRVRLNELKDCYLPFSPDRDTLRVLQFGDEERDAKRKRLVKAVTELLERANYEQISLDELNRILTSFSPHGLALSVDIDEYEELLLFRRGADMQTIKRGNLWAWMLGRDKIKVPVYKRLFMLLKLKPQEERLREIMVQEGVSRAKAEKILARNRANIPGGRSGDYIYLKVFKNIPQTDLQMMFPNTHVQLKLFDKVKLGVTAGGGLIGSVAGSATKLTAGAILANPLAAAAAIAGLAGVIYRQVVGFFSKRNEYMLQLAQRLYFHSLADNRGVLTLLVDRAGEEDVKEEMLLYYFLAVRPTLQRELDELKRQIEQYLSDHFAIFIDFDLDDALQRLTQDGLVYTDKDGRLRSMTPGETCIQLQRLWDASLEKSAEAMDAANNEDQEI